jgi:hypothetical protein
VSIKVMSWVWDNSPHSGGALVVLLAIADFAHEDGSGAFPSVETLAAKARLSKRQTQTILKELNESGELLVAHGGGRRKSNTYTVVMENKGAVSAPFSTKGAVEDDSQRQMLHKKGEADSAETVMPTSPEPSEEPLLEPLAAIEPKESPTGVAYGDTLKSSTEEDWRRRILTELGRHHQIAVLVDMVHVHSEGPYEPQMGGRAAALMKGARDPARAVSLVWSALVRSERVTFCAMPWVCSKAAKRKL